MQPIHSESAEDVPELSDDFSWQVFFASDIGEGPPEQLRCLTPSEPDESDSEQSEGGGLYICRLLGWALRRFIRWNHSYDFLPEVIYDILTNHGYDYQKLTERWNREYGPPVDPDLPRVPYNPSLEYDEYEEYTEIDQIPCSCHRTH